MRGKETRALRAAIRLGITLFFFEGGGALAQAPAEPVPTVWHVISSYGQASAPRSQGFAEALTLSVARDFRLFGPLKLSLEVMPVFVVRETRVDLPERPRSTAFAGAAIPLVAWDAFPGADVGLRLEGGAGILYATSPVPAEGSHFNFLDVLGARVRLRLGEAAAFSIGVRRTHVSNMGVVGPDNPGLSFYAGALALDLSR